MAVPPRKRPDALLRPDDTHRPDVGRRPPAGEEHLTPPRARARRRTTMSAMSTAPLDLPDHLFTAIDHVGIAVPDLDEAIAFYRDTYGMRVVHEETNEEQGVREAMVGRRRLRLLHPAARAAVRESTIAKFLDRTGPGIQQLAYRVDRRRAVAAILRERGVRLLYDEPRRGTSDSRVNFVHPKDAGGVLVELVEPAAGALTPAPAAVRHTSAARGYSPVS